MSLDIISERIQKFISSSEPEAMSISGAWGSGKTYTWKKLCKKYKKYFALKKYSYVSLFGINSIESLKTAIFQEMIEPNSIETGPSIQSFSKNVKSSVFSIAKNTSIKTKNIQFSGLGQILSDASFLYVKEAIICIDNLERRESNLSLKDILGLVDQLKEERRCKIILISNDDQFNEEDRADFQKLMEKVLDSRLRFSLTPKEAAEIVLTKATVISEQLKELITRLNLKNIRIIQKIERLMKPFEAFFLEKNDIDVVKALHPLVLFTTCFYDNTNKYPSINYLIHVRKPLTAKEIRNEEKEKNVEWETLLDNYGYFLTRRVEHAIAIGVANDYFDKKLFNFIISQIKQENAYNKRENAYNKVQQELDDVWKFVHHDFDNTDNEAINKLENVFYKFKEIISAYQVDEILCFFKKLEYLKQADSILENYISIIEKDETSVRTLRIQLHKIKDTSLSQELRRIMHEKQTNKNLHEILDGVVERKISFTKEEDLKKLAHASVEEYYNYLKKLSGDKLHLAIDFLLEKKSIYSKAEKHEINRKTKHALTLIGKESKLNAIRVSRYGIDILDFLPPPEVTTP